MKKLNAETFEEELTVLADDFELTPEMKELFIEQVKDYMQGTACETWEEVYCYIDGLLTPFGYPKEITFRLY